LVLFKVYQKVVKSVDGVVSSAVLTLIIIPAVYYMSVRKV